MCRTNTAEKACNQTVHNMMINRSTARVKWCAYTKRCIQQTLAGYRLTPGNVTTQLLRGYEGRWESVFNQLCRKIHCHFPENPQFGEMVYPKLKLQIQRIFKELHDKDIIIIYRDPGSTAKKVYWPPYTRTWCRDDWDDEPGGTISDHDKRLMEEYEAGGPLPPFLLPEPEPEPEQDQHQPAASFGRPSFSRRVVSPSLPRPSRVVCSSLPPSPSVSRTQPRSSSASQQQPVTSDMAMDDDDARSEVSVMSRLTSASTLARDDQLHRDLRQQVLQLLRERAEHAQNTAIGAVEPPRQGPHNSNVTAEVGDVPRPARHSPPGCGTSKSAMRRLVRRLAKEAATLDGADEQQRRL